MKRPTPEALARSFRTVLVTSILVAGVVWSLPTEVGSSVAGSGPAAGFVPARFQVTVRHGTLTVAGHTLSAQHEADLRRLAARYYPHFELQYEFRPLGLVPGWWAGATEELLATLATAVSPGADLDEKSLRINAVVADTAAFEEQLDTLASILPPSLELERRLVPAGSHTSARDLCERQFDVFHAGPIRFEESGTTLRTSAYPELDRIVTLADACRGATLTITGHTDASGSEASNRQLSLARARAVATYLAGHGVAAASLVAAGAGSAEPIADNATRYGRSLNRRIDVRFSYEP